MVGALYLPKSWGISLERLIGVLTTPLLRAKILGWEILELLCLLSAGSMGLWHGVEYYEKEKVVGEQFYQQWNNALRGVTTIWYDWSYILAWLSVGFSLISSILFFSGANCLRAEREADKAKNVQYIMPGSCTATLVYRENSIFSYDWSYIVAWIGVGWSLVSAILFSSAAICLRSEREKEEAMNMQYLMPVYPQKQQYAYTASYPAPAAAYPGPYYHGSQYGPYNY
uniref:Uncharacterized protein n=1 Tax=Timema bartmani TaxID=61472 RepID=A0A7R9F2J3_9NEOP|nr:unnamed protein product [Timema bartmani]